MKQVRQEGTAKRWPWKRPTLERRRDMVHMYERLERGKRWSHWLFVHRTLDAVHRIGEESAADDWQVGVHQ